MAIDLEKRLPAPSRARLKKVLLWAFAVLVLVYIGASLDPVELVESFRRVDAVFFIATVLVFSFLTILLDSFTHFWMFRRFNPPADFKTVLRVRAETYLLLSLGFLYGQGGMAVAYSRRTGRPLGEVVGSIAFITLNTFMALMIMPSVALALFGGAIAEPGFTSTREGGIILVWLAVSWPLIFAHFLFWGRDWKFGARQKAKEGAGATFDKARAADYSILLCLRMGQMFLWIVFSKIGQRSMGIDIPLSDLLALAPMAALMAAIPTPGRYGSSQAGWVLLFGSMADPEALFAFSLLWTTAVNLIRWATGSAAMLLPGASGKGAGEGPDETGP